MKGLQALCVFLAGWIGAGQSAGDPALVIMRQGFLEALGGTIPAEVLGDLYKLTVHTAGGKALKKIKFSVKGSGSDKEARLWSYVMMYRLRKTLFGDADEGNVAFWDKADIIMDELMRKWWNNTPENGVENVAWKALVEFYATILKPLVRDSPGLTDLQNILKDPEMRVLKTWVDKHHQGIVQKGVAKVDVVKALQQLTKKKRSEADTMKIPDLSAPEDKDDEENESKSTPADKKESKGKKAKKGKK